MIPKRATRPKSRVEMESGSANQKQMKAQSQAEAPMAGSMATSRWRLRMTVKLAIESDMTSARNLPNKLPDPSAPTSMMPTPAKATALAINVEVWGFSAMKAQARPAVMKGTVA